MCWKNINHRLKWWEYVTQTLEGWTTRCCRVGVCSKSILPWKLVIFKWLMMKIWTMRYLSNLKRHIWSEEFKSKVQNFIELVQNTWTAKWTWDCSIFSSIEPKLDIGLFVDLAEFPSFCIMWSKNCSADQNKTILWSCKNWGIQGNLAKHNPSSFGLSAENMELSPIY